MVGGHREGSGCDCKVSTREISVVQTALYLDGSGGYTYVHV